MSVFIRKVKTKSGAIAVQVARRKAGRDIIIKHLGSAHTQDQLQTLIDLARSLIIANQLSLFKTNQSGHNIILQSSYSQYLYEVLEQCYQQLHFDCIDNTVFKQLVIVRIIESTSKLDTIRVLSELGLSPPSKNQ